MLLAPEAIFYWLLVVRLHSHLPHCALDSLAAALPFQAERASAAADEAFCTRQITASHLGLLLPLAWDGRAQNPDCWRLRQS